MVDGGDGARQIYGEAKARERKEVGWVGAKSHYLLLDLTTIIP